MSGINNQALEDLTFPAVSEDSTELEVILKVVKEDALEHHNFCVVLNTRDIGRIEVDLNVEDVGGTDLCNIIIDLNIYNINISKLDNYKLCIRHAKDIHQISCVAYRKEDLEEVKSYQVMFTNENPDLSLSVEIVKVTEINQGNITNFKVLETVNLPHGDSE